MPMSHNYMPLFSQQLIYRQLDCVAKEWMVRDSSGGVDRSGEVMMGEEAAEAGEASVTLELTGEAWGRRPGDGNGDA